MNPTPPTAHALGQSSAGLLGYERVQPIHDRILCVSGEMVMQRRPFRWLLNGEVMSNCYESFEPEGFVADKGLEIVQKINADLCIVRFLAEDAAHAAREGKT